MSKTALPSTLTGTPWCRAVTPTVLLIVTTPAALRSTSPGVPPSSARTCSETPVFARQRPRPAGSSRSARCRAGGRRSPAYVRCRCARTRRRPRAPRRAHRQTANGRESGNPWQAAAGTKYDPAAACSHDFSVCICPPGEQSHGPRADPPGILGKRVADAVIAVVRIKRPPEDEPQIVGHIERRDQPERECDQAGYRSGAGNCSASARIAAGSRGKRE